MTRLSSIAGKKASATKPRERIVRVELPPKLIPVFMGKARYRGAYGGRGSGKTRSFAKMAVLKAFQWARNGERGAILCAREYMNSLTDSSRAEIKEAIFAHPWLSSYFIVNDSKIKSKNGAIQFLFAGLYHNLNSLKSKAGIKLLWIDEAEHISEAAWQKIIPTIREKDSEIWLTWNPEYRDSATHRRFRENPPLNAKIIELNWRDNPWFPEVLEQERLNDLANNIENYRHIWEGDFVTYLEGSYFARALACAREEGRIASFSFDPLMKIYAFWDIGGSGAKADASAIWIGQFIGDKIYILDYYEAQGQPLAAHIAWLKAHNYHEALMVLPHDGARRDFIYDVSFASALEAAGFYTQIIPNQGSGAARLRIEAVRRIFPKLHFNEKTTQGGLKALEHYHEKRDKWRNIGLGPVHDWASHGADAFGLMAIAYEELAYEGARGPFSSSQKSSYDSKPYDFKQRRAKSWMAS